MGRTDVPLVGDGGFLISCYDRACSSCLCSESVKLVSMYNNKRTAKRQKMSMRSKKNLRAVAGSPLTSEFPLVTFGARALEPITSLESQSTLLMMAVLV